MADRSQGKGSSKRPAGLPPNREPFEYGNINETIEASRRFRRGEFDSVPGLRQMRRAINIGLGAVLVVVLIAIAAIVATHLSGPRGSAETRSGVRVWVGPPRGDDAMTALIEGTVVYNRAEDCFQVVTPSATFPVVWPHGSKGTADPPGVVLEDGTTVHDGDSISFGGGYVQVADDYGIPASCLPPTGEVAVIQTT
jgi:hypothetical protein